MRKLVLYTLGGVLFLIGIVAVYWQRSAADMKPVPVAAPAQESDCATPPPPEEKPAAPAGLAMTEPCADGTQPAPAAPVR
jgi:hypothetical protein